MYSWILAVGYFGDIFPAGLMLLGPILSLIGGGECVFMSTISAIITDVAPNEIERYVFCTTCIRQDQLKVLARQYLPTSVLFHT